MKKSVLILAVVMFWLATAVNAYPAPVVHIPLNQDWNGTNIISGIGNISDWHKDNSVSFNQGYNYNSSINLSNARGNEMNSGGGWDLEAMNSTVTMWALFHPSIADLTPSCRFFGGQLGGGRITEVVINGTMTVTYASASADSIPVGASNVTTDIWVHFGIVFDYGTKEQKLYINGIREADVITTTTSSILYDGSYGFTHNGDYIPEACLIYVSDMRVWNVTLTDAELRDAYDDEVYMRHNATLINETIIYEGLSAEYMLNLTDVDIFYENVSIEFYFNNTQYNILESYNVSDGVRQNWTFMTNVTLEQLGYDNPYNMFSFWNYTLMSQNTNTSIVRSISQVVDFYVQLDNCSNASNKVLNISFFDEDVISGELNANLRGDFFLYTLNNYYLGNFTVNQNDSHVVDVCLLPNMTVLADANMYSIVSGGFTQRWFLINATLSNDSVSSVDVYNRPDTTGVSNLNGVVRTTTYDIFSNVYALLQRYYPAEGVWRTVQMDKSDEFGQIFFNIIEESVDYKIRFQNYTSLLETTDEMKFICTSGVCTLTFQVSSVAVGVGSNLILNWSYDNGTEVGTLTWSDTTGLTNTVRLLVQKTTYGDSITICDTTTSASSGSIACNTSLYTGTFMVRVFASASPDAPIFLTWINKVTNALMDALTGKHPNEGMFWSMGIAVTIAMMGLVSPVTVIVTFILGLIFVFMFSFTNVITIAFIIGAAALGIIIAIKVKK